VWLVLFHFKPGFTPSTHQYTYITPPELIHFSSRSLVLSTEILFVNPFPCFLCNQPVTNGSHITQTYHIFTIPMDYLTAIIRRHFVSWSLLRPLLDQSVPMSSVLSISGSSCCRFTVFPVGLCVSTSSVDSTVQLSAASAFRVINFTHLLNLTQPVFSG